MGVLSFFSSFEPSIIYKACELKFFLDYVILEDFTNAEFKIDKEDNIYVELTFSKVNLSCKSKVHKRLGERIEAFFS